MDGPQIGLVFFVRADTILAGIAELVDEIARLSDNSEALLRTAVTVLVTTLTVIV